MKSTARRLGGYLLDMIVIIIVGLVAGYRAAEMTSPPGGIQFGLVAAACLLLRVSRVQAPES